MLSRRKKIIISGYYGFDNVGDEAILYVLIKELRRYFQQSDLEIIVLSNNPTATTKHYSVRALDRWKFFKIFRVLSRASAFISGGGGLIQDVSSRRSAVYYLSLITIAQHYCPVFIVGQSLGPIHTHWIRQWAKWVLRRAMFSVVRDRSSLDILAQWGISRKKLILSGDLSWLLYPLWVSTNVKEMFKGKNRRSKGKRDRSYVVVVLKGPRAQRKWDARYWKSFKENMASQLDHLSIELNSRIVFLIFHPNEDLSLSRSVATRMKHKPLIVRPSGYNILKILGYINRSKAVIGMRLHSLILSALTLRPFIAISDEFKIDNFLQDLIQAGGPKLPRWAPRQLEDPHIDLAETLVHFDAHEQEIQKKLVRAREVFYNQTRRALDSFFTSLEHVLNQ